MMPRLVLDALNDGKALSLTLFVLLVCPNQKKG